jgi:carotenoid cleavage dioxygenase
MHVAVSRGALTRTIRSIDDAPTRIRQLELTRDDVVLVADGFIGLTARAGANTQSIWFEIDMEGWNIAGAYAHAETVIAYAIGPSLVRWTLDRRAATAQCEVLDPTPYTSATSNRRQPGSPQRFLWTVGAGAAHKHDLFTGGRRWHDFGDGRTPGELVFVADPDRSSTDDGGWLVGFVHDDAGDEAEFVVLDAESIERPAIGTVRIPRRVPTGARGTWISATRPNVHTR